MIVDVKFLSLEEIAFKLLKVGSAFSRPPSNRWRGLCLKSMTEQIIFCQSFLEV